MGEGGGPLEAYGQKRQWLGSGDLAEQGKSSLHYEMCL